MHKSKGIASSDKAVANSLDFLPNQWFWLSFCTICLVDIVYSNK